MMVLPCAPEELHVSGGIGLDVDKFAIDENVHGGLDLRTSDREALVFELARTLRSVVACNVSGYWVRSVWPTHHLGLHPEIEGVTPRGNAVPMSRCSRLSS
jgi:hypothetical protein